MREGMKGGEKMSRNLWRMCSGSTDVSSLVGMDEGAGLQRAWLGLLYRASGPCSYTLPSDPHNNDPSRQYTIGENRATHK